jgi:hypothetical protein
LLEASQFVLRLEIPKVFDRSLGDIHPGGNPHVHLDPRNIAKVAGVLAERLARIDPPSAGAYQAASMAFLQRWHLILPPAHHQLHHTRPFTSHYCITTGWLNWPLNWARFFPVLEWCITTCTGALPRRDDLGTMAAEQVMAETQPGPPPARAENRVTR